MHLPAQLHHMSSMSTEATSGTKDNKTVSPSPTQSQDGETDLSSTMRSDSLALTDRGTLERQPLLKKVKYPTKY